MSAYHQPALSIAESPYDMIRPVTSRYEIPIEDVATFLTSGTINDWDVVSSPHIRPTMTVLYTIFYHNWMPTINKSALNRDRAILVYMVANTKLFNFGKLVYDQIIASANAHSLYRLVLSNMIDQLLCYQRIMPSYPGDHTSAAPMTFQLDKTSGVLWCSTYSKRPFSFRGSQALDMFFSLLLLSESHCSTP